MKQLKSGVQRGWHWWQSHVSPGWFAVLLAVILIAPFLFYGQVHGYADDGDFARAILPNGIYPYKAATRADYFGYVAPYYHVSHFYNGTQAQVFSSQTIVIKAAMLLNQWFFSHSVFNIRFMGVIYFALFLGALYMLTQALTMPVRRVRSYFIAAMLVFVFGDSVYTLYFNSFYAEPVGYIALLYAVASLLMLSRRHNQRRWPLVALYVASVIILITSKQQNAPLALSFVVASCGLLFVPGLRRKWLILGAAAASVCVAGVATFAMISQQFSDINLFQTFSYGIMFESPDYTKELPKYGISGQYALDRNEAYNPPAFGPVLPSDHETQQGLTRKLSTGWVVRFLVMHPKQLMNLLDVAAKNQMNVQVRAVGDFTKQSGAKSLQQARYMTGYSVIAEAFYPRKYMFDVLVAVVVLIMCASGFYQDSQHGAAEGGTRFMVVAALLTIVIFVPIVSIIGDGTADLAKHLFLVPVSLNLIFTMLAADALTGRLWHAYRKEDEDEAQ